MVGKIHVLVALPLALAGQETEQLLRALGDDDQCGPGDHECSLALLQLRGAHSVAEGDTIWGSCKVYGCTHHYHHYMTCQCNEACKDFNNCCSDYEKICAPAPPVEATCQNFGCGEYVPGQACQCNEACAAHNSCCSDYEAVCKDQAPPVTPPEEGEGGEGEGGEGEGGEGEGGEGEGGEGEGGGSGGEAESPSEGTGKGGKGGKGGGHEDDDFEDEAPEGDPCESAGSKCSTAGPEVGGHPREGKKYPDYDGFTLSLVEEFDTAINLDDDKIWTWSDGGLIEGQIRFAKEAITFSDGKMRITASKTLYPTQNCSNAEVGEIEHKDMTSGEMRTRHNMFRYGRYEASIRAPEVQPGDTKVNGNYISTMFVFRDAKYKHWREIDMELTGDHPDALTTNVLSADNTSKWKASIAESEGFRVKKNLRKNFHTIAFEWLPDRISWYFEGKLIREKRAGNGNVPIPDLSGKIMMNLWMFDERALFGGEDIENNRYPMTSEYEWFRFYKWEQDTHYPCPGFSMSCLTNDDMYLSANNPCDNIPQIGTVYGETPCIATCPARESDGSASEEEEQPETSQDEDDEDDLQDQANSYGLDADSDDYSAWR